MRRAQGVDWRTWVVSAIVAALVGLNACASNRTPERSFTTRDEAGAAGMFDAAGVPEALVPSTSHTLRERRDLSTGEFWARFEVDAADRERIAASCRTAPDARLPGAPTRGIGWWPELLRTDVAVARQHFDLFACETPSPAHDLHVAVHRSMPTVFVWRSRR